MAEETEHGTTESKAVDQQQACSPPSKDTQTASRWVWWIARLAMNQPYPRVAPKVGDTVVETTHLIGLARHRLGLHKAFGTLLEIDESGGEYGKRYLIKSHDPEEGETWWSNAMVVVVEENSDYPHHST